MKTSKTKISSISVALIAGMLSTFSWAQDPLTERTQSVIREAEQTTSKVELPSIGNAQSKDVLNQSRRVMADIDADQVEKINAPIVTDLLQVEVPPVNIEELSNQGTKLFAPIAEEEVDRYETQILVFVSSSMPTETLSNYLLQTSDAGAAMVLRGLVNNSMQDTRKFIYEIIEAAPESNEQPTFLIDPTLYDRFDIAAVPTIVVTESQIKPCVTLDNCPTPVYHEVRGDVSLSWALELVKRQISNPDLKKTLAPMIRHLEGRS